MNTPELLFLAGVEPEFHASAVASIELADKRSNGILWHKIKVRYFKAKKIAKAIGWDNNRYIDVNPDGIDDDIAPMQNITAHGDKYPHWVDTPEGGRPGPDQWMNKDPNSTEYKEAVAACYWSPGNHPRSYKAVKDWYKRNGGEGYVWRIGIPVDFKANPFREWKANGVTVVRSGDAWIIKRVWKAFGIIPMKMRKGFEVDNLWRKDIGIPSWYPIDGYDLRAPVTWSTQTNFSGKEK